MLEADLRIFPVAVLLGYGRRSEDRQGGFDTEGGYEHGRCPTMAARSSRKDNVPPHAVVTPACNSCLRSEWNRAGEGVAAPGSGADIDRSIRCHPAVHSAPIGRASVGERPWI